MALRDLVEGECGGANSLVRLTSHIVQDRALKEEGFRHPYPHGEGFSSSSTDQLVQQFFEETLGQTTPTFRMDSLLAEMRDLERGLGTGPPIQSAPIAQLAAEQDVSCWADQYLESGRHFQETSNQDSIWSTPNMDAPSSSNETFELGFGPNWAKEYLQSTSEQLHLDEPEVNLTELGTSEEYSSEATKDDSELKEVAKEILDTTADDNRFTYSKFMKFMRQVSEGEVNIEDGEVRNATDDFTSSWHNDLEVFKEVYEDKWKEAGEKVSFEDKWKEAGQKMGREIDRDKTLLPGASQAFIPETGNSLTQEKETEEEWAHSWTQDYNDFIDFTSTFNKYKFAEDNPMANVDDALAEGRRRLEAGDIPSAVLCFEAAAAAQPANAEAWQLLGTTQAQNEQDPQAIAAFKKCLEIEPNNLTALMGLAVSYTNENFDPHACRALKDWLRSNPKYSDLVQEEGPEQLGGFSQSSWHSTMDLHKEVCDKFIAAARRSPLDIDPDVQCGLGVLFNLTNEQDKAVDCFKAALQARPNDFTMWNRLGATLANGGRPEEAVDAYHNALQLYPGFIRARYNLGITCTHLGAHRAAVEHLLTALNQQAAGRGVQGVVGERQAAMSDTIWTTLRLVSSFLDRPDVSQAVNDRDLEKLNKEFIDTGSLPS